MDYLSAASFKSLQIDFHKNFKPRAAGEEGNQSKN